MNPEINQPLELTGVIGYNGTVNQGLILHPADQHIIYPLGSTIVIKHLLSNSQTFLQKNGHEHKISCLSLSSTGKYLCSGEESFMGFPAQGIVWDIETYEILHKLNLHKGKIQACAFSPDERFLVTLGGRDDNKLVVWDVKTGEPICGSPCSPDTSWTVKFLRNRSDVIVTGGNYSLRVWQFDLQNRKIRPTDCQMGQTRRVFTDICVDENDEFMYCATKSGDIMQVSLGPKLFKANGPKAPLQLGINCLINTGKGNLLAGSGNGTVSLIQKETFKVIRSASFEGAVTSLALNAAGDHFFVGTSACNIYCVHLGTFEFELRNTCHSSTVLDVAYPRNYSELFATSGAGVIRIWHARTRNELLRIQVPNLKCTCLAFMPDGKSIVSGWDDGKIRAFKPRTGTLMYTINDAHRGGVSALAVTSDNQRIVSGGKGGNVRVWAVGKTTQPMLASMKEHKGTVTSVQISDDDTHCVSASEDGSSLVWSLERFARVTCLLANNQFKCIRYHPDQCQLLTCGTDRKITFWDVADGNPIRIVDGSKTAQLNCLAISPDGSRFVSGGGESLVHVWGYDEAHQLFQGHGHSGAITACAISPDSQTIVTCGDEGGIFMWKMPEGISESKSSRTQGQIEGFEEENYPTPRRKEHEQQKIPAFKETKHATRAARH